VVRCDEVEITLHIFVPVSPSNQSENTIVPIVQDGPANSVCNDEDDDICFGSVVREYRKFRLMR